MNSMPMPAGDDFDACLSHTTLPSISMVSRSSGSRMRRASSVATGSTVSVLIKTPLLLRFSYTGEQKVSFAAEGNCRAG